MRGDSLLLDRGWPCALLALAALTACGSAARTASTSPRVELRAAASTAAAPDEPSDPDAAADGASVEPGASEPPSPAEVASALGIDVEVVKATAREGDRVFALLSVPAIDTLELTEAERRSFERLEQRAFDCRDLGCAVRISGRRAWAAAMLAYRVWRVVEVRAGGAESGAALLPAMPSASSAGRPELALRDVDADGALEAVATVHWAGSDERDSMQTFTATFFVDTARWSVQGAILRRIEEDIFAYEGSVNELHLTVQRYELRDVNEDGRPDVLLHELAGAGTCRAGADGSPEAYGTEDDFPSDRCLVRERRAVCHHRAAADDYACHRGAASDAASLPRAPTPLALPRRVTDGFGP